jgi:hypothetical protein
MKNIFALLFVLTTAAVMAQPKLSLDTNTHNFGTLNEGEKVTYDFVFTNTGDQPLVIFSATQPCGCTTPTFPKEPIMPGKTGKISVEYNSEGHPGTFMKKLQIRCNDPIQYYDIFIMGDVLPKPVPQPPAETN